MHFRNRLFLAIRASKRRALALVRETQSVEALLLSDVSIIDAEPVEKALINLYRVVGTGQAKQEFERWMPKQKNVGFGITRSWVESVNNWFGGFIKNLTNDIKETTWKGLTNIINKNLQQGRGYEDIIKEMEATGLDRMRAARIARTETNKGMNAGKVIGTERIPYQFELQWIAGRDNRTRGIDGSGKADHFHMNGQRVPKGGLFTDPRSGSQLAFPGDTDNGAGPADVVNCRCAVRTIRVGRRLQQ